MLLYALGYLVGYPGLDIEDLKQFRQLGSKTAGPSRIWPRAGRRDDHRAARPGPRHRRRHGDRRAPPGGAFRRRTRRSFHLCARRRRLPDGGRQPRGDRPRRPFAARQADRALGRQFDLHRRADESRDLDRPGGAVQGQRLACATNFRPRLQADRRGADAGEGRSAPVDDRLPHDDRLRRSRQGGQGKRAWRAAGLGADRRRARER